MVIRSFFDRNNTIILNDFTNTGRNPVAELFYGGQPSEHSYSRFLFHFNETHLRELFTGGCITDLTKLKHTLRMVNTGAFDTDLLGQSTCGGKDRACSFDLNLFEIDQPWDEGVGFDFAECKFIGGSTSTSICPSNWFEAQTGIQWSGGNGVFSGSPTGNTIVSQHFEAGNENIEMDITDIVNEIITGKTNNGFGIVFPRTLEETNTDELQFVGFFTRHTNTFYEPHIESIYSNHITDDRADFFLDKSNKLYLYTNLGHNPTNLDSIPSVDVFDHNGLLFSSFTPSAVTHVQKGVYCIELLVPTTVDYEDCLMFTDTWKGITINGVVRPDIELEFALKDSSGFYNFGNNDLLPKDYGFSVSGIRKDERIKRGDTRKVIVSARIPFTVEQKEIVDRLQYRLYVREGKNEFTVIDFEDVERAFNHNFFLLDTSGLIPNTYMLDIKLTSNQQVTTIKDVISFDIVSQSELRGSQ